MMIIIITRIIIIKLMILNLKIIIIVIIIIINAKPEQTSTLPPLFKDDIVHSDETKKANKMNDFFC